MHSDINSNEEIAYRRELIEQYRPCVERLVTYIPWLESKRGTNISTSYGGQGIAENSVPFPVYDSTLMALIKLFQSTPLMDRNYVYIYSRNRIKTHQDEIQLIHSSDLKDIGNIKGIISKYVMEGMRRGTVWTEAVYEGLFLECILQLKKDIEFWDVPIY